MQDIVIFSGTTEGRLLSERMTASKIYHTVCVATDYGKNVMKESAYADIHVGRLNRLQMESFLRSGIKRHYSDVASHHEGKVGSDNTGMESMPAASMPAAKLDSALLVFDATHPYAVEATKNISDACRIVGAECYRIVRDVDDDSKDRDGKIRYFPSHDEAARTLENTTGNILLTTGSKNINSYIVPEGGPESEAASNGNGLRERLYVRVLPSRESIEAMSDAGIKGSHIIAMQGPFSEKLNKAILEEYDIKYLVTKAGGKNGGYGEKLSAAESVGVEVFVITQGLPGEMPPHVCSIDNSTASNGLPLSEAFKLLGIVPPISISLIGIGPGHPDFLTLSAKRRIESADMVFGAKRMIESAAAWLARSKTFMAYMPNEVIDIIKREYADTSIESSLDIAILFSGDTGFFSGASKMREGLLKWAAEDDLQIEIDTIPGISSVAYFASKLGVCCDDSPVISLHGKSGNPKAFMAAVHAVSENRRVFLICSGGEDLKTLGGFLLEGGANGPDHVSKMEKTSGADRFPLSNLKIYVGRNLSYTGVDSETIVCTDPVGLLDYEKGGLYTVMIENSDCGEKRLIPVKRDVEFERGRVPMTKEMIRHAAIIRLDLTAGSVLYDVGSGTGAVAVEAASLHSALSVYAFEKNNAGVELTSKNGVRAGCANLVVIPGEAPEAFEGIEPPTHVFIGGSGGRLCHILQAVRELNNRTRIVITAVTLETVASVQKWITENRVSDYTVEQISVAGGLRVSDYTLMKAQNPVYIFAFTLEDQLH